MAQGFAGALPVKHHWTRGIEIMCSQRVDIPPVRDTEPDHGVDLTTASDSEHIGHFTTR